MKLLLSAITVVGLLQFILASPSTIPVRLSFFATALTAIETMATQTPNIDGASQDLATLPSCITIPIVSHKIQPKAIYWSVEDVFRLILRSCVFHDLSRFLSLFSYTSVQCIVSPILTYLGFFQSCVPPPPPPPPPPPTIYNGCIKLNLSSDVFGETDFYITDLDDEFGVTDTASDALQVTFSSADSPFNINISGIPSHFFGAVLPAGEEFALDKDGLALLQVVNGSALPTTQDQQETRIWMMKKQTMELTAAWTAIDGGQIPATIIIRSSAGGADPAITGNITLLEQRYQNQGITAYLAQFFFIPDCVAP
ncbi:hypothetical protein DFH09DRAFT_1320445 [Mycena vulgaris]|nr:hypothetical protein DFH09DRAFT_1320445 [Mycena vulgaris]